MIIPGLTINMMVKNESRYIERTLRSVLPYAAAGIIVDTGSTDDTVKKIFNLLNDPKWDHISFEVNPVKGDSINWNGNHLSKELTAIRNDMLFRTETDWVWQVDGDEIYTPLAINDLRLAVQMIRSTNRYQGIQVPIKWCPSDFEYILPGPFPKTLRVMPKTGKWIGEFPNEFLYVNGIPMTMNDSRCFTTSNPFLHMSMALHPERRPANGDVRSLTLEELTCLNT